MTTTVTVDAHAGWHVLVTTQDGQPDGAPDKCFETIVEPNTEQSFYVFDGRSLLIKELKTKNDNS